jgi:hypothetical protein
MDLLHAQALVSLAKIHLLSGQHKRATVLCKGALAQVLHTIRYTMLYNIRKKCYTVMMCINGVI